MPDYDALVANEIGGAAPAPAPVDAAPNDLVHPNASPGNALWGARKRQVTQAALEAPDAPRIREPDLVGNASESDALDNGSETSTRPVEVSHASGKYDALVDAQLRAPAERAQADQQALTFAAWRAAHAPKPEATQADDQQHLESLSGYITWPARAAYAAGRDALKEQQLNAKALRELWGVGAEENRKEISGLQQELATNAKGDYGAKTIPGKALVGGVKMAPQVILDLLARAGGGLLGSEVGGAVGGAGGAAAGATEAGVGAVPAAVVGELAGAAGGAEGGQFAGSMLENYYQAAPQLYLKLQGVRDEHGQPLDPSTVRWAANLGGLANGALMALAGGPTGTKLAAAAGGESAKNALGRLGGNAIASALAQPGVGPAIGRYIARVGAHEASGALVSALGGAVNAATEELAKGDSAGASTEAVAKAFGDSFTQGLQDMLFLSLGHAAIETRASSKADEVLRAQLVDQGQHSGSMANALKLQGILESGARSSTLAAVPDQVERLAARAKQQPGAVQAAYIDRGAVDRLAQDQGIDPRELGKRLAGDDGSAYDRAKATPTGDLVVPIEKYVRAAADPETRQLFQDTRLNQDDLSPREMKESAAKVAQRSEELKATPVDAMDEAHRQVFEDWKARARGAGVGEEAADANARLAAAFFQGQAERFTENGTPTSALDLRNAYDVRMKGKGGQSMAEPTDLAQPAVESPTRQAMREHWDALLDDEQRARFFTDQRTGLYNFRGYEARAPDPSRPFTTELQLAQGKTVNDTLGHDAGDSVLKVMGNVLRERGIPDAVRRGNTVSFDHATKEEGAQVAQAVKEAIGNAQVVTHGTTKATAGMGAKERLEAAGEANTARREEGKAAGKIPERDAPFGPGAAGLAKRLAAEPTPKRAEITPEHDESYTQHLERAESFDTAHLTPEGLLTEDGFHLARELAEKRAKETGQQVHYVSADARGIKAIDTAFGHHPTDEIMSHVSGILHDLGGAHFDVARPHGDEFYAVVVGDRDRAKVDRLFKAAAQETDRVAFWKLDGDSAIVQEGVKLAHGLGSTFDAADREALPAAKGKQSVIAPRRVPLAEFDTLASHLRGEGHVLERVGGAGSGERSGDAGPVGEGGPRGGSSGGSGDAGEAGAAGGGRPLYVAPGVEVHPSARVPDEGDVAAALAVASKRNRPTLKAQAEDFVQYVRDYLGGKDTRDSSKLLANMPRELLLALAKVGIVDPHNGFHTTEDLQRQGRGGEKTAPSQDRGMREQAKAKEAEFKGRLSQEDLPEGGAFHLEARGRGSITFTPPEGGTKRRFDIELLKNADKSTLAHETFHFMSEVMGDLAQRPDAPDQVKADYGTLLKFMGYDDHAQRVAEGGERRDLAAKVGAGIAQATDTARERHLVAKEERGSHAWEQFLLEGKTPSAALARPFARFAKWMLKIYRGVQGIQDVYRRNHGEEIGLSDDVRGVFSRLLASDDEVNRAQAADAASKPFEALRARMTPEEQRGYDAATLRAGDEARQHMLWAISEAQRGENSEFVRNEKESLRAEVNADLDKDPTFRAMHFLQDGELPGAEGPAAELLKDPNGKPYKLDRRAMVKAYGPEFLRSMPRGIFAGKGETGIAADGMASLLGFDDGRALVESLQKAPPRQKAVESEVQTRLEAKYGPSILDDHEELTAQAIDGLHNSAHVEKAMLERRKLAEQIAPGAKRRAALNLDPRLYESTAARIVAGKTVDELTGGRDGSAGYYLRAERTAARRAQEAVAAGKIEEALAHNEAQLLNSHLWRAARDSREKLESGRDLLRKATGEPWQTALGKADVAAQDHAGRDATNGILQAVGIGEGQPDPRALDALLAQVDESSIGFDADAIRDLLTNPKDWGDLTQDQAQNVVDAVKNIRHVANAQNGFELEGKRIDRAAFMADFAEHAAKGAQVPPEANTSSSRTLSESAGSKFRGLSAYLTSIQNYVDTLDGGDRDGPAHRLFVDELRERYAHQAKLDDSVTLQVKAAMDKLPKELRKGMNEVVPGLDKLLPSGDRFKGRVRSPTTRAELWTVMLNAGNEGNLQRLQDGNGWSRDQVNQALQLLHAGEADFLQGLLDTIQSLKPELAKVHEQRTGLPMGSVEATPITIAGKEYRGGYFPIRYDPRIARQGAVQQAGVEASLFPQGYTSPTVATGHTKARAATVTAPLSLEFGTVQAHLAQVVSDIALGDWVRKAGSVVLDDKFKAAADGRIGPERTKLFLPWLRDIATERAGSVANAMDSTPGAAQGFASMARSAYATAAVGLNLSSMLAHLTDPLAALAADNASVGEMPGRLARIASVYPKAFSDRPEYALSKELALRDSKEMANVRRELGELNVSPDRVFSKAQSVRRVVAEVSNWTRHHLDQFHGRVLFLAGYEEGLARGMTQDEAARRGDDFLAQTLPSGSVAEKPAILRSKSGLAAVVTLYGYASKMHNLWVAGPLARAHDAWAGPDATLGSRARSAGDLVGKWLAMGAIGAVGALLAGRGAKDDEDKTHAALRRIALEPTNTIPILGPAIEAAAEGREPSVRTAPGAQLIYDSVAKVGKWAAAAERGEGGDRDVWQALEVLGALSGPVAQSEKTFGYLHAMKQGDVSPNGPGDVAKGLVYGTPPKR